MKTEVCTIFQLQLELFLYQPLGIRCLKHQYLKNFELLPSVLCCALVLCLLAQVLVSY